MYVYPDSADPYSDPNSDTLGPAYLYVYPHPRTR